jgi:23S rRNA (guanine745-N1)-methyltransferase
MMICPVCGGSLHRVSSSYRCPHGHTFDVAREGYVNLLLPQEATKPRGDTKAMLLARRRFLDVGYYAPISTALNRYIASSDIGAVLEVGCGEGYYIGQAAAYLGGLSCFGVDISKEAARLAAKRYPGVQFAVEDAKRKLLFEDESIDAILSVFAPRNPAEFARVLRANGVVLVVSPEEDHLAEVRTAFNLPLGIEADKTAHIVEAFSGEFQFSIRTPIQYRITLNQTELRDLVMMTPNAFHLGEDFFQRLETPGLATLETTVHCILLAFQKADKANQR